ncbi:MAG: hypothetical protein R3B96_02565 [Pirellulaceae bacterium]
MRWFVAVGLLVGLVSFGCDGRSVSMPANEEQVGSDVSPRGSLTLTGSSTVAPLAQELALLFERKHPEARIDLGLARADDVDSDQDRLSFGRWDEWVDFLQSTPTDRLLPGVMDRINRGPRSRTR